MRVRASRTPPSPAAPVECEEVRDGAAMTQPPFHRSALEHRSLDRLEAVDAGGQECLNRGRDGVRSGLGIVGEHREHLLDEEWVAFGRVDDALPKRRRDRFVVDQPADELLGVGAGQG